MQYYSRFSLVGVVKSVLTTLIGFFTFGGVPVTFLTLSGVFLNTFGGVLYSYAKYLEKKAAFQSIHDIKMQFSGDTEPTEKGECDIEKGKQDSDVIINGIDDRTRA